VFEKRAQTKEAKLEIELARLAYELPRIRDDHSLGDREGGGGRAARGHTNVELAKQRIRGRMAVLRRDLDRIRFSEEGRRESRTPTGRAALVGYTNAGKSSIMRLLTGSNVLVENKLFATLGTTIRQLTPPSTPPITVVDTVGFINRLPHDLVASFRSTLAEARDAELLLIVADASDENLEMQIAITQQTLDEIGAQGKRLILLNKIDQCNADIRANLTKSYPSAILICAIEASDGAMLRDRIIKFFVDRLVSERLSIPYNRQNVLAELRGEVVVVEEKYGDEIEVTVRATTEILAKLKSRLAKNKFFEER
jgi:GTP-binding protein HflX